MLGKNFKYKWIDFTDETQELSVINNWYWIILQNNIKDVNLRTDIYNRANYHWSYSSETLSSWRLFTFTGKIVGTTKTQRYSAWNQLISAIQPENYPWVINRWFYNLERQNDNWDARTVKAKVFQPPIPSNWLESTVIDFTFELYAENEKIYDPTTNTATGSIWYMGWMTLSTTLPQTFTWYAWKITCNNSWNRAAPIKISVVWNVVNPKIFNITNWQKYRITKTISNLIYDNRNLNNKQNEILVVTDEGSDIRAYRNSWWLIYLEAWTNELIITADSFTWSPVVTITWRDTYFY